MRTVPVEELPLELPATKNFQPHYSGDSPLANCEDWLDVEIDGQKGRREGVRSCGRSFRCVHSGLGGRGHDRRGARRHADD